MLLDMVRDVRDMSSGGAWWAVSLRRGGNGGAPASARGNMCGLSGTARMGDCSPQLKEDSRLRRGGNGGGLSTSGWG